MPLKIFFIAGLLPDKHDARLAGAFSQDGLCRIAIQVTAAAVLNGFPKRLQSTLLGQELCGISGFRSWHVLRRESIAPGDQLMHFRARILWR